MILPNSITNNIVQQDMENELLIYQLENNKALSLNQTASLVFRACDGETSLETLKQQTGFSEDLIFFTLDELKRNNLIETEYQSIFTDIPRRKVIKQIGLASMVALPTILSVVAPTATLAASAFVCNCSSPRNSNGRLQGCPCGSNNDCCGLCLYPSLTCSIPYPSLPAAACCHL